MGDPYRKRQVEYAKKRRELAVLDASIPRLPTQPTRLNSKLALMPQTGAGYVCGEKLAVIADGTGMRVIRNGYEHVGAVEGESAETLRQLFATDGGTNVVQVLVTDVAHLSGVACAELCQC